jgi:hypothetical protein
MSGGSRHRRRVERVPSRPAKGELQRIELAAQFVLATFDVAPSQASWRTSAPGTSATLQAGPDMSALGQFANIPRQGRQVEKVRFSFKQPVGDAIFSVTRTVTARDTIFRKPAL